MNGETSPRRRVTPHTLVTGVSALQVPSRRRRVARDVARFVVGAGITFVGIVAAGVAQILVEPWLAPPARLNVGIAVAVAVWLTAGHAWLRPRSWPRLLVVVLGSAAAWLLVGSTFLRWLGVPS